MNSYRTLPAGVFLLVSAIGFFGAAVCEGAPTQNPGVQVPAAKLDAAASAVSPPSAPSYKSYTYYGDHYRDPFIPLNGDMRGDQESYDRTPQVSSLALKGIVQDAKGRMALLTSGINSYILRGGRLYDNRNKMIKKIAGVIKTDSVVIIGSDRTVRELKTKAPL
jgi:hypothetical protein